MAVAILAATVFYTAMHRSPAAAVLLRDTEGFGIFITLIGAIYAVMFAFVIFVIWGQFTEVENAALHECSSLNDLLRFAQHLNPDVHRAVRRAVAEYAQRVANSEWHALAERRRDVGSEKAFAALIAAVVHLVPANPAELGAIQRLSDFAKRAGEYRDERIAKSLTRIPPTLLTLVRVMAAMLAAAAFVYPFHSVAVGAVCFAAIGAILALANLVMTDTDNPFEGVCNVSAQPFLDLAR